MNTGQNEHEDAKERIREAVRQDQAHIIEPLLYKPNLSEEQNTTEGRWIREMTTFDEGYIWDRRFLSLLHFAVMNAAKNCVQLLLDQPFSWDVDREDGDGNLPLHYAFTTDVPSLLYLVVTRSRKTYTPVNCRGTSFQLLLWPQLVGRHHAEGPFYIYHCKNSDRVIYPWQINHEEHLECSSPFALWLEMAMGSSLTTLGQFWTGSWESQRERPFWPIPQPKPGPIPYHDESCGNFAHCLDQLIARNGNDLSTMRPNEVIYRLVLSIWAFHSLTELVNQDGIEVRVTRPPTLRRICRARIRRQLIGRYGNYYSDPSRRETRGYYHLIETLPIPLKVKQYLLYSDLWPTYINLRTPQIIVREAIADPMDHITFEGDESFGFIQCD